MYSFRNREASRNDGILRQQLNFRLNILTRLFLELVAEFHGGEDVRDLQEVLQHLNGKTTLRSRYLTFYIVENAIELLCILMHFYLFYFN